MNRQERENLFIAKETELQRRWINPRPRNRLGWEFVKEWSDKELDDRIKDTVGQLRFEKGWDLTIIFLLVVLGGFVVLGFAGLLLFGIRQIFSGFLR